MPHLLLVLVAVLAVAKVLAIIARRIGQPAVLGELLAGVLLGGSVFGLLDPADPVIEKLAELGVIILLFEIGLNTDMGSIARVFGAATAVAIVGVVLPFVLGYATAAGMLGIDRIPALVCAAALTATSIGISARVLSDIGRLKTAEGQVVLGAAVLDDIIGLIILAVTTGIVSRESSGTQASALVGSTGSAMILGAFAVGMVLHHTRARARTERVATWIGHLLVPIFFASVGAAVKLSAFTESGTLAVAGVLIAAGVLGKYLAGFAPWWFRGNKSLIGVAMIPRGEVGLIFAQMGLATQAITPALFSAITLMVLVTTFLAPPLLARIGGRNGNGTKDRDDAGIDALVAGD